jgi:hypothetical protein
MAVPVINTVSKTKSTGLTKLFSSDTTIGAPTTTWTDIANAPQIPSVTDGETIWMKAMTYHSTTNAHNNWEIQVVGVTTGTVLYAESSKRTYFNGAVMRVPFRQIGFDGIVKNTGATENIKIQYKNYGSNTAYFDHAWCWGTGVLNWVSISAHDKITTIKTTMQIDDIDIFCVSQNSHGNTSVPSIGANLNHNDDIKTYTPNRMVNELSFLTGRTTTTGNYMLEQIGYTYTGKELTMS